MIANGIALPNGAKCAAGLTFDMDADSLIHIAHPGGGHTKVSAVSHFRYGRCAAGAPGWNLEADIPAGAWARVVHIAETDARCHAIARDWRVAALEYPSASAAQQALQRRTA